MQISPSTKTHISKETMSIDDKEQIVALVILDDFTTLDKVDEILS